MSYNFRTTTKLSSDMYVEDAGYPRVVRKGDDDFATLNAEFGKLLKVGETAQRSQDGDGWDISEGCPMLDAAKAVKLDALNKAWLDAEAHGVIASSVGFDVDANERANRDINGLISAMTATKQSSTMFCGADNAFHEVTLNDLKTMLLEIIGYAQGLYAKKWAMRSAIEDATDFDALNAVEIKF